MRPGRRARHAVRPAAQGRSALALFLEQALLELAQARIHRRQRIEVTVVGAARDLELLDRGRQAAAQLIEQITGRTEPRQIVIPARLS